MMDNTTCRQHLVDAGNMATGDSPDTTMASLGPQVWKPQVILLTSFFLLAWCWARLRCWVEAGWRWSVVVEDRVTSDQCAGAGDCD